MDTSGNRIRLIRETLGLTQAQFGKEADVAAPIISVIESGKRNAGLEICLRIVETFGVDLTWLVMGGPGPVFLPDDLLSESARRWRVKLAALDSHVTARERARLAAEAELIPANFFDHYPELRRFTGLHQLLTDTDLMDRLTPSAHELKQLANFCQLQPAATVAGDAAFFADLLANLRDARASVSREVVEHYRANRRKP